MNKKLKILLFIILIIVVAVIVFIRVMGYKRVGDFEEKKIKIGVSITKTIEGEELEETDIVLAGLLLAQKEINDKGGILGKEIELIIEDNACEIERGIEVWNKIINIEKPVAIIGPLCSLVANEVLSLAQDTEIPVLLSGAGAPDLTKAGNYIFNAYPSIISQSKFVADYIFTELNKDKVAVFYIPESPYNQMRDVFIERFNRFKELGAEVVFDEVIPEDKIELKNQIERIRNSNADVLYILSKHEQIAEEINKENLGLNVFFIDFVESLLDFSMYEGMLYPFLKIDISKDFENRISEIFKGGVNFRTALYYDALNILAQAIEGAGKVDRELIRNQLEKTSYRGVAFPIVEFDNNREIKEADFEIKTIKNGKSEVYIIEE